MRIAIRSASLVFDIMDATEIADNGDPDHERHHPPEDVSAWCLCGNCRHMPSAAEQLMLQDAATTLPQPEGRNGDAGSGRGCACSSGPT